MSLIRLYRLGNKVNGTKLKFFSKIIFRVQKLIYNSVVPHTCEIGEKSRFAYGGIGVVLHSRVKIGVNVVIGQGITIGGRSKQQDVPVIGDNVYIGAGSRILGNIKIGDNVIIAPNAVVIRNVESNSIVAGIPAKIIKSNIRLEDYI